MSKNNNDLKELINIANKAAGEDVAKICSHIDLSVETISTGSLSLDDASGIGGLPRGRIIEIYGPESCGKTTLTLGMIANIQKEGGRAAFLDMEHALDPKLASGVGVNIDDLLLAQPKNGEQCFDMTEALVKSGKLDIVVIDSVAAMVPKAELEGEMTDANMGAQARMIGKGLRKITGHASNNKTIVIFINQLREKIGNVYGNPETTPGGKALKFFSSLRLDVRRKEPITEGKKIIGNHVNVKFVKNKMAMPHSVADVTIMFGKGVDNTEPLVDYSIKYNFVEKSGNFLSFNGSPKLNGKEKFMEWLKENNQLDDLIVKVKAEIKKGATPLENNVGDDDEPEPQIECSNIFR